MGFMCGCGVVAVAGSWSGAAVVARGVRQLRLVAALRRLSLVVVVAVGVSSGSWWQLEAGCTAVGRQLGGSWTAVGQRLDGSWVYTAPRVYCVTSLVGQRVHSHEGEHLLQTLLLRNDARCVTPGVSRIRGARARTQQQHSTIDIVSYRDGQNMCFFGPSILCFRQPPRTFGASSARCFEPPGGPGTPQGCQNKISFEPFCRILRAYF